MPCCRCGKPQVQCATHEAAVAPDRVLLPAGSSPAYDVDLTLRLNDHAFDGTTTIKVAVAAPATTVQLHAKELAVAEAKIDGVACKFTVDAETTTLLIAPATPLAAGDHVVCVKYSGILNDLMCGFYRSTYTDVKGEKKLMASTQFESIDARRCFPCWDEPRRKATFACSLTVPAHMTALSNMPEKSTRRSADGASITTAFAASPRMSTYLLSRGGRVRPRLALTEERRPHSRLHAAGQARARGIRARVRRGSSRRLRHDLRDPLPFTEIGHGRDPRIRGRRHGELGPRDVSRGRHVDRQEDGIVETTAARRGSSDT